VCLAIPGQVTKVKGKKAIVEYPGQTRSVLVGDEKANVGDYVLVQMGIVVKKLSKTEAQEALKAWKVS
jgi:hydrogenase assembly chaperone HypC/HupF